MSFTDYLTRYLNRWIDNAELTAEHRIAELKKDPFHAFEWAHGDFEEFARGKVAKIALANLEKGAEPHALLGYARREVMRCARYPQQSTSITSNECHRRLGAAWAELADTLENELS